MFLQGFWFVGFCSVLAYVSAPVSDMYGCSNVDCAACALYECVDSHCVCAFSCLLLLILSSKTLKYAHKYIYITTLLPPASAQAVLAVLAHSVEIPVDNKELATKQKIQNHCNATLQHNTTQHTPTHSSKLTTAIIPSCHNCTTLQHTATHYNTWQHT